MLLPSAPAARKVWRGRSQHKSTGAFPHAAHLHDVETASLVGALLQQWRPCLASGTSCAQSLPP